MFSVGLGGFGTNPSYNAFANSSQYMPPLSLPSQGGIVDQQLYYGAVHGVPPYVHLSQGQVWSNDGFVIPDGVQRFVTNDQPDGWGTDASVEGRTMFPSDSLYHFRGYNP